jgi:hypothetical protein
VGTKVMVLYGNEWTQKCCSARGMSGHESAGPLRECLIHFLQVY